MGIGSRAFLAGGLGFAVSFVVACGGGNGLLTGDQADSLNRQLSSVSSAVQSGDCGAASSAARSLNNTVADLPSTVNTTLVQNLGQGAATVSVLAAKNCRSSSSSSTSSSTPTSTSTSTTTTTSTITKATTSTNPTSSSSSSATATTPPSSSSTSTSNGGAGFGGTGTAGNQNGQ